MNQSEEQLNPSLTSAPSNVLLDEFLALLDAPAEAGDDATLAFIGSLEPVEQSAAA